MAGNTLPSIVATKLNRLSEETDSFKGSSMTVALDSTASKLWGNGERIESRFEAKVATESEKSGIPVESVLHALHALRSLLIAAEEDRDSLRTRLAEAQAVCASQAAAAACASQTAAMERAAERVQYRTFIAQLQRQLESLPLEHKKQGVSEASTRPFGEHATAARDFHEEANQGTS